MSRPVSRAPSAMPIAGGDPHAERAGRHVEARQAGHVGVALEARVGGVERRQLLDGEVAAEGHGCVQADRRVALGQDEPVAVGPGRLVGPDAQDVEVEGREHVGRGQRTAEVAAPERG